MNDELKKIADEAYEKLRGLFPKVPTGPLHSEIWPIIIIDALRKAVHKAKVEALREAARSTCPGCRDGCELTIYKGSWWWHPAGSVCCRAAGIHDLIAEIEKEASGG